MPGLLSSAIELVEHQVSVVHRVLQDPFQRYLLADEVGLGKTIETGILIRQYVLDKPESHRVLVIVRNALTQQWKEELRRRFHLEKQLGDTIHVIGHRDATGIEEFGHDAGMVVVDEAHHLSAWAYSEDADLVSLYRAVERITTPPERSVLLLSATPILHNEAAFLAMLHLIDPLLYSLTDLEAFRLRVTHRQEVAEAIVSLAEDKINVLLEQTLERLSEFFPVDDRFHDLRRPLSELIGRDVAEDDAERCRLIRSLRVHVSETWRLHRRLLRNRRSENRERLLPGRSGCEICHWESSEIETLEKLLNEWRLNAAQHLYEHADDGVETHQFARLLVEAAACERSQ
jgi:ATP-dependent helicase HepA